MLRTPTQPITFSNVLDFMIPVNGTLEVMTEDEFTHWFTHFKREILKQLNPIERSTKALRKLDENNVLNIEPSQSTSGWIWDTDRLVYTGTRDDLTKFKKQLTIAIYNR